MSKRTNKPTTRRPVPTKREEKQAKDFLTYISIAAACFVIWIDVVVDKGNESRWYIAPSIAIFLAIAGGIRGDKLIRLLLSLFDKIIGVFKK